MRKSATTTTAPAHPEGAKQEPIGVNDTREERVLAVVPPEPDGFDDPYEDDLVLPRFSIVQPTSQEGTPGTFRSSLTGEERRELHLVPLRVHRGRVLWSDTLGTDPVCNSDDGISPSPSVEKPVSAQCCVVAGRRLRPVCRMAQWEATAHDGAPVHNGPPPCRATYTLVGLDLETQAPFFMTFHGTAILSVKVLRTVAFQKRLRLYDTECTLRLRLEQNGKGSYYVPEFCDVRPVDPPGLHRAAFERYATYDVQEPLDDEPA
jgi:hypothetical protein